jgi:hypothetical protein
LIINLNYRIWAEYTTLSTLTPSPLSIMNSFGLTVIINIKRLIKAHFLLILKPRMTFSLMIKKSPSSPTRLTRLNELHELWVYLKLMSAVSTRLLKTIRSPRSFIRKLSTNLAEKSLYSLTELICKASE